MAGDIPTAGTEAWQRMKPKKQDVCHLCTDKREKGLGDLSVVLELR